MAKGFSKLLIIAGLLVIAAVFGVVFYLSRSFLQKGQQPSSTNLETIQPTPQTPQTSSEDLANTSNWKTFNNSKNKYSIKHPPSFEVRSIAETGGVDSVQFSPPNETDSKIVLSWHTKDKKITFSDWTTSYMKNYEKYKILERKSSTTPPPSSLQVISIDTSITLDNKQIGSLFVFIQKDEESIINLSVTNPAEDESLRNVFNQMLSTFELLE